MSTLDKKLWRSVMERIKAGASQATALTEVSRWISENTTIRGRPYSYKDREYQKHILDSDARESVIIKPSQIGISEVAIRKALGLCGMIRDFTVIYTLPTAKLAMTIMKTRANPVIRESRFLHSMITDADSVDVKGFSNGSFLYMNGAASTNAPISIPADALFHDEVDFSDALVMSQYQSRLTNSEYKIKMHLSTPTLPGHGIHAMFANTNRYFNFTKCNHCGHFFIPDYYEHVKIPGYTGELTDIHEKNLHTIDYTKAFVECPRCGGHPDLADDHREWVCQNQSENHVAKGTQVSPFDVPKFITPGYLVEASTKYHNIGEFINFNLGKAHHTKEAILGEVELRGCIIQNRLEGGVSHVMGLDMGKTCHIVVASVASDGAMQVVHIEKVPLIQVKTRYAELRIEYRVRVSVVDSLPYTDTVMALQAIDNNLWACVYTGTKGTHLFTVKQQEEDRTAGEQFIKQINVARDRTFDALMEFIRSGQFSKWTCRQDDEFIEHCTSMRRVKDWNMRSQVMEFKWLKSEEGNDHYFFALKYAFLAKHVVGTYSGAGGGVLPLVGSFSVKPRKEVISTSSMQYTGLLPATV